MDSAHDKGGRRHRTRWFFHGSPHDGPDEVIVGHHIRKEMNMLWTIFVILLVLWLLGMVTSYTLGGAVHILLVLAIIVAIVRIARGSGPVV